ncbi:hypothetical protein ILYODFUR_007573 [Ilyodon furcidens]|uniref:Uncharacterized protein n=1 Tax=Ilyodon furcidens TaxID=33524 RepID=A0ABV0TSR5_9TELE
MSPRTATYRHQGKPLIFCRLHSCLRSSCQIYKPSLFFYSEASSLLSRCRLACSQHNSAPSHNKVRTSRISKSTFPNHLILPHWQQPERSGRGCDLLQRITGVSAERMRSGLSQQRKAAGLRSGDLNESSTSRQDSTSLINVNGMQTQVMQNASSRILQLRAGPGLDCMGP